MNRVGKYITYNCHKAHSTEMNSLKRGNIKKQTLIESLKILSDVFHVHVSFLIVYKKSV